MENRSENTRSRVFYAILYLVFLFYEMENTRLRVYIVDMFSLFFIPVKNYFEKLIAKARPVSSLLAKIQLFSNNLKREKNLMFFSKNFAEFS